MSNRNILLVFGLSLGAASLSGCGFQPLYGTQSQTSRTSADLTHVQISTIPERSGQILHTELERRLHPRGAGQALYRLSVMPKESIDTYAVERSSFATRAKISLKTKITLTRVEDREQLMSLNLLSSARYNLLSSNYATSVAEDEARKRALIQLADTIHNRLALYFAGPGLNQPELKKTSP